MQRLLLLALAGCTAADWHSAMCDADMKCTLVRGDKPGAAARGKLLNHIFSDGWGKVYVTGFETTGSDGKPTMRTGAYASGFVEGALTADLIRNHYLSWYTSVFTPEKPLREETMKFMQDNWDWSKQLAADHAGAADPYYARLDETLLRVEGILAGIEYANEHKMVDPPVNMTMRDMIILQNTGDLYDILPATNHSHFKLDVAKLGADEFREEYHKAVSCSCIIKAARDLSDVFAGHTTWSAYENFLRVFKHWEMRSADNTLLSKVSFPSKPGIVFSKDDLYMMEMEEQRLVVIETTNGIMKQSMYEKITPKSLMTWSRIPIVNALATNGEEWTKMFARYNSGTYANQWMVVNMNRFNPGEVPQPGFLWIIENVPEMVAMGDVTKRFIDNGFYWPSMNVPYFESIYKASGFDAAFAKYGDEYSYENCPRHKIFKRDHHEAGSMQGIGKVMRYNQWQSDPYSEGSSNNQISARGDLLTKGAKAWGGIDSKVTSWSRIVKQDRAVALAQNGPTHDSLPPFRWSATNFTNVHLGQPDLFDFGYAEMHSDFDYIF